MNVTGFFKENTSHSNKFDKYNLFHELFMGNLQVEFLVIFKTT